MIGCGMRKVPGISISIPIERPAGSASRFRAVRKGIGLAEFADRFAVVDEVLGAAGVVGDRRAGNVDAQLAIKGREDLLEVDRSVLGDFAQSVC